MKITDVAYRSRIGDTIALSCNYQGFRYHVWVEESTGVPGSVLYKNHPPAMTKRLKADSKPSRALISAMLLTAKSNGAMAKFLAEEDEKTQADRARHAVTKRENVIRKNALVLHATVMAMLDRIGMQSIHCTDQVTGETYYDMLCKATTL